jgi:hypothetical protein
VGPAIRAAVLVQHILNFWLWMGISKDSQVNTTRITIVLSIDTRTEIEPGFICEEWKFWVKNTRLSCKSPQKVTKCVILSLSPVSITWTCVILYGRRCNFLIALHALVSESCDYSTNRARDFRGKCKLPPISSVISTVNTVFSLAHFMSKEDPAENTSFTNSKVFCGARFQAPECLWPNLVLYDS